MNPGEELRRLKMELEALPRSRMEGKMNITVEIADVGGGMIVRYQAPIKTLVKKPGSSSILSDPGFQAFLVGLMEVTQGDEDDSWKGSKAERVKRSIEKLMAMNAPKEVEQYVWERRTVACKTSEDLMGAIELARQAHFEAKSIEREGKFIMHGRSCFGPAIGAIGEAYMPPPAAHGPDEFDADLAS